MVQMTTEMPRYKCHKEVWALKIKAIEFEFDDNSKLSGALITPEENGYARIYVHQEYIDKHKPEAGGYYVVYKDGYKSWSPAKAFEEGYTRAEIVEPETADMQRFTNLRALVKELLDNAGMTLPSEHLHLIGDIEGCLKFYEDKQQTDR